MTGQDSGAPGQAPTDVGELSQKKRRRKRVNSRSNASGGNNGNERRQSIKQDVRADGQRLRGSKWINHGEQKKGGKKNDKQGSKQK